MGKSSGVPFRSLLAGRLRAESRSLSETWLKTVVRLLSLESDEVFPGDALLDHIPSLIAEIAADLEAPERNEVSVSSVVVNKARELGALRYAQGGSIHQILREYDVLADVLEEFALTSIRGTEPPPAPPEVAVVIGRILRAVRVLMRATVDTFIERYGETIGEQRSRLVGFNRIVGHELRNPIGTLKIAWSLLRDEIDADETPERRKLVGLISRSVERFATTLRRLDAISDEAGDDTDLPHIQRVDLSVTARNVFDQLGEMAGAAGVDLRVASGLPSLTVDLARLELALLNLVSNSIKYRDSAKRSRFVEIGADVGDSITLHVRDNGIGIPDDRIDRIFERYFRAHEERDAELGVGGDGLGLAIVADCVRAMEGHIDVESREGEGTVFHVHLLRGADEEGAT